MILKTAALVEPTSATQQDTLILLLQDREWVNTQFAAIMATSGFGDRVIVRTLSDPPRDRKWSIRGDRSSSIRGDRSSVWRKSSRSWAVEIAGRVRSPPSRA